MSAAPLAAFHALLGTPSGVADDAPVLIERLDVLAWGRVLVLAGKAGARGFELRYTDCRDLRWRVYVADPAPATPLVGFSPGRDQQRSPAQLLTAHFGLTLYYGDMSITITP